MAQFAAPTDQHLPDSIVGSHSNPLRNWSVLLDLLRQRALRAEGLVGRLRGKQLRQVYTGRESYTAGTQRSGDKRGQQLQESHLDTRFASIQANTRLDLHKSSERKVARLTRRASIHLSTM